MPSQFGGSSRYHSDSEAVLSAAATAWPKASPVPLSTTDDEESPSSARALRIAMKKKSTVTAPAHLLTNESVQEPGQQSVGQPRPDKFGEENIEGSQASTSASSASPNLLASTPPPPLSPVTDPTGSVSSSTGSPGPEAASESQSSANLGAVFARTFHSDNSRHVLLHCVPASMSPADIHAMFSVHGEIDAVNVQRLSKGVAMVSYFDTRDARTATLECNSAGLGCIASTCVQPAAPNLPPPIVDTVVDFWEYQEHAHEVVKNYVSWYWTTKSMVITDSNVLRIEFFDVRAAFMAHYHLTQRPNLGKACMPPVNDATLRQARGLFKYLAGSDGEAAVTMDDPSNYVVQPLHPEMPLNNTRLQGKPAPLLGSVGMMPPSMSVGHAPQPWVPSPRPRYNNPNRASTTSEMMGPTATLRNNSLFRNGGGGYLNRSNSGGSSGSNGGYLHRSNSGGSGSSSNGRGYRNMRSHGRTLRSTSGGNGDSRHRTRHGSPHNGVVLVMNKISTDPQVVMHDGRSSVMIRNIPNKYTRKMILQEIDAFFGKTYDFFYLPIDFENKCNFGYAFINFIDPATVVPFCAQFDGKAWQRFKSEKKCQMCYARLQGKNDFVSNFKDSTIWSMDPKFVPLLCHSSGECAGEQDFETMSRLEESARNAVGRLSSGRDGRKHSMG